MHTFILTLFTGIWASLGTTLSQGLQAVLYRYTQVLQRQDLFNSKGKPLVTTTRLEAVWERLVSRFKTVVVDSLTPP